MLALVDLDGMQDRSLNQLSSGQLQRAYVARALAQEASVLMLDESLSGVDQPSTTELFDVFERLVAGGSTLLIATHDLALARTEVPAMHGRSTGACSATAHPTTCCRADVLDRTFGSAARGMIATGLFEGEYLKALVGACIIGVVAPVVGTWIVLRRMANLGDTMSHGTLAGVAVAYAAGVNILLGALGAGVVIAVLLILFSASQRLGHEAIIAVMGSALFALGIIIISRIDTTEELEHILFGDVLQLTWSQIWFNLVLGSGRGRRGAAALQRAAPGDVRSRAGRTGRRPRRTGASGLGRAARCRRGDQPSHGRLRSCRSACW